MKQEAEQRMLWYRKVWRIYSGTRPLCGHKSTKTHAASDRQIRKRPRDTPPCACQAKTRSTSAWEKSKRTKRRIAEPVTEGTMQRPAGEGPSSQSPPQSLCARTRRRNHLEKARRGGYPCKELVLPLATARGKGGLRHLVLVGANAAQIKCFHSAEMKCFARWNRKKIVVLGNYWLAFTYHRLVQHLFIFLFYFQFFKIAH